MAKINIEDLLGRKPIVLDEQKIASELSNKIILVTGAAGSIGSGTGSGTTGGGTTATEVTKTGTSIRYRFGTIQVSVTKTAGKITAVNLLQAGATGGRGQAFDFLVQYTIDAQGSSFGNISGATYTTAAYKQSLDAALAQF